MLWAQIFPFVALQLYTGDDTAITIFLVCSFALWMAMNVAFFCTIDLDYIQTFFSTKTATQYTVDLIEDPGANDMMKFDAAFTVRVQFIDPIREDVKDWVANNIAQWEDEKPDWYVDRRAFRCVAQRFVALRRDVLRSERCVASVALCSECCVA